jgi:putative lacX protein
MNHKISNQKLIVEIAEHGAEIKRILFDGVDYLHDSNPIYWNRSAPILFPNIGTIKDGKTIINDKSYPMLKHGFLRDREFRLESIETSSVTFSYTSKPADLDIYPFSFRIEITYQIHGNTLKSYIVVYNLSDITMPFQLGLHPAFKVPLFENETFEEYTFMFDEAVTCDSPAVNLNDGTIDFEKVARHFEQIKELPLNYSDYENDALIFSNIPTRSIKLVNKTSTHGVDFEFNDFPLLGIWTPNHIHANFICIEPWIGCADASNHNGKFTDKKYMIQLAPKDKKLITYQVKFF